MNADRFRQAYFEARAGGFRGTRAEFADFVLSCSGLFRGPIVAGARAWQRERGQAPAATHEARSGTTLLAIHN